MRKLALASFVFLVAAACGDNKGGAVDAPPVVPPDGADIDAPDGPPPIDGELADGIGDAKGMADGMGLALPINFVIVTYLKPQIGSTTNDPAGFTIQRSKDGPGLFVSVDPATTTPPLAVGDVVSFQITQLGTVGGQKRAQAIDMLTRHSTGFDVATLSTDVSAATDLVSAIDTYDSRLVDVTGTAFQDFAASGQGFQRAGINTAGITGDTNLQVRAPVTLVDAIDMVNTCTFALKNVPVGRFNAQTQIAAFVATDLVLTNCPAPVVTNAISLSATEVRFTFSRNIKDSSVNANGSDFTFDNGLTASAAVVAGRTVTVTTTAQAVGTTYATTIANTVTDLQNTPVSGGASFSGFLVAAKVRINEVNATITGGCDMIELRVTDAGSMAGFKLTERNGGTGELNFVFPAGFIVQKNDFIIVHTIATAATCNTGAATQETVNKNDQPSGTFPGNFDTAFDFWAVDNGLTDTDNVFTLRDATDTIIDAVFISNDPAGVATAAATETAAAAVGAANQWDPALATYLDAVFRMNAADDLNATGTTQIDAGTSNTIQRINDADTNSKADWTTGSGAAQTWGALNAGQAAL